MVGGVAVRRERAALSVSDAEVGSNRNRNRRCVFVHGS